MMDKQKKQWTAPGAQFFGSKVTVVLVRPIYARNVGYVSRSMGNMGCDRLVLVEPGCQLDAEARQAASRAQRALHGSIIYDDWRHFFESEGDGIRIGLTARGRKIRKNYRLETTLEKITRNRPEIWSDPTPIYLIYGPEDHGLSMEDLRFCHHWCSLGAFGYYPSLNISHAVLLGLYNLRRFLELRDLEKGAASQEHSESIHPTHTSEPKYEIKEIESWRKQWDQPSEQDELESKEASLTETSQSFDSEAPSTLSFSAETEASAENTEANTQDGAKLQPFYYPEDTLREWVETMGLNTREKKVNALTVLNRMILESDPTQRELKILETLLQQNMRMLRQSGAVRRQRGLGNPDHDL